MVTTTYSETPDIYTIQATKSTIGEHDNVYIKKLWVFPVPTNYEVQLLLKILEDCDPIKIGFGLILVAGMRPVETTRTTWKKFRYDAKSDRFTHLYHEIYKASNRKTKIGRNLYFKQVKKIIADRSDWFNDLLKNYHNTSPDYGGGRLFPFHKTDSYGKFFSQLRKRIKKRELPPAYDSFLIKPTEHLLGCDSKTNYKITPYSLRRFAITFLYWSKAPVGYDQDIVALSRYVGHSNPKTTYDHYVMPKEAIGLTQEMIDAKIGIDQFINCPMAYQQQIPDFVPKPTLQILPQGQCCLSDF